MKFFGDLVLASDNHQSASPLLLFIFFGYANFSSANDSRTTITEKSYNSHQIEMYISMVMVYVRVYMVVHEDVLVVHTGPRVC